MLRSCFFLSAITIASIFALPSGPSIKHGKVQVTQTEKKIVIDSGKRAVINWDSFSVGKDEKAHFQMKNAKSSVLNRVTGGNKSEILGSIESNGNVYLLNAKGILFGKECQINVNSLVASTLDVLDENFLRGGELHFFGDEKGSIVNMGNIDGNAVFLLASSVENHGTIQAKHVGLATGSKILLQPKGAQRIFIEASNEEESIENSGTIEALTTEIKNNSPYVLAVRSSGTIDAIGCERRDGKIFLVAESGTAEIDGALQASHIELSGNQVFLYENAKVEAPQGKIFIGGDPQNLTENLPSAQNVTLYPGSHISASASERGDGGEIYIYSEGFLAHHGHIEARGGDEGGDGGFVELSSRFQPGLDGIIDRRAPKGKAGTFLLDPKNVNIVDAGGGGGAFPPALITPPTPYVIPFTYPTAAATLSITGASLSSTLNMGDVIIECSNDCSITDTISGTAGNNLTIRTGRSCTISGTTISTGGGDLNISVNHLTGVVPAERDAGVAAFSMSGTTINLGGGNFNQEVGTFGGVQQGGVNLASGSIDADGGNIRMRGFRLPSETGVLIAGIDCRASLLTSGIGNIDLEGVAGGGSIINNGIILITPAIEVENGMLTLNGTGGPSTANLNSGVLLFNSTLRSVGTANPGGIAITGVAGTGTTTNDGVTFFSTGNSISTIDGPINITGTGNTATTTTTNRGVGISSSVTSITSSGSGDITIVGEGGGGTPLCHGIAIDGAGATITAAGSGAISLTGTAGNATGAGNSGIFMSNGIISSTSLGEISLIGTGNTTSSSDSVGVEITGSSTEITTLGSGNITISGDGGATAGNGNNGVIVDGTALVDSSGSGNILIVGRAGAGVSSNVGITVSGNFTTISSSEGEINLNGRGAGNTDGNTGVELLSSALIIGTGDANITFDGIGSGNGDDNNGVEISGGGSAITIESGKITIEGQGANGTDRNGGVSIVTGTVSSTTGEIEIVGIAGNGVDNCVGVLQAGGTITSETGVIAIDGRGSGDGIFGIGISITGGSVNSTGTGSSSATINLVGRGSPEISSTATGTVMTGTSSAINSIDGAISIIGLGGSAGGDFHGGVAIQDSAAINSTNNATVTISGTGGAGTTSCVGINFNGSSELNVVDGNALITGRGTGTGDNNFGVVWDSSFYNCTGDASVNITGTLAPCTSSNAGIIVNNGSILTTTDGDITLFGTGNGNLFLNGGVAVVGGAISSTGSGNIEITGVNSNSTGTLAPGVYILTGSSVTSSSSGTIRITGTGGQNAGNAFGLYISEPTTTINSTTAEIFLTGIATASTEEGMKIDLLAEVESLGSAPITVTTFSDLILESGGKIIGAAGLVTIGADRDFVITGSNVASENTGVILGSGSATISAGRDITLAGGSAADTSAQIGSRDTTSSANITFTNIGRDLLIDGNTSGGYAIIGHGTNSTETSYSGNIRFDNIRGDATIMGGSGSNGFAQIGHLDAGVINGDILLTTNGSINVLGGTSATAVGQIGHASAGACTSSTMRLIAGQNIEITSSTADAIVFNPCTVAADGTLTLVVDNRFPTFPNFGPGQFILNSTELGTAAGELRIYTVQVLQNTINDSINGQALIPGPFDVDNNFEEYDIYFAGGSFVAGSAFRIYYKVGNASKAALLAPFLANTFYNLGIANSQLNLPIFRYMRLPNYPWHHGSFSDNLVNLDPGFDPYQSFIFEDNLYWIGATSEEAI